MKAYSRKQMGVVYRAMKEGRIAISKEDVSYLYDWADADFAVNNTNDSRRFDTMRYGMKNAVDAIFAGDYKAAQTSIENMLAA